MSDIAERSLHTRIARSVEAIRRSFVDNLFYVTVRTLDNATPLDHYTALAYTIRDRLLTRVVATNEHYKRSGLFSSDRAIREYNENIWRVKPLSVEISKA
jgi:glucan phosphorylase